MSKLRERILTAVERWHRRRVPTSRPQWAPIQPAPAVIARRRQP